MTIHVDRAGNVKLVTDPPASTDMDANGYCLICHEEFLRTGLKWACNHEKADVTVPVRNSPDLDDPSDTPHEQGTHRYE